MDMAFVTTGERGGMILVHEGFRYQKNRTRANKIHWRCWRPTCRAPLSTNIFDVNQNAQNIQVFAAADHEHEGEQELLERLSIRRRMIENAAADPAVTARQTYDNIAAVIPRQQRDSIPTFDNVRSSIDRERKRHIPPIPATINDVSINGRWRLTEDGDRFLSRLDNGWGVAIFCTEEALSSLGECNDMFMDGTFKSVPRPYLQLFTIHGYFQDRVIPLVYVLMADRQIGSYRRVLIHLKNRYRRITNNNLSPVNVILDFEPGMINAVETEFPASRVFGCFFHFCRSIWRRVQREGLKAQYSRHASLRKRIRKLMAIAFLPLAVVRQNFILFIREQETINMLQRYQGFARLLQYFNRNYLNGQFPPALWNVYLRTMDNRTNNHVEAFNRRWNSIVGRKHPNLWYFLKKLKSEEKRGSLAVAAVERGDAAPTRRRKYRLLQARINRLQESYRRGQRPLDGYWNAMIYSVAQFR